MQTQHLNIRELHNNVEKRHKMRYVAFDRILEMCHAKIKYISTVSDVCACIYTIPKYLIGMPAINMYECAHYMMQHLINDGFKVIYTDPHTLFITWYDTHSTLNKYSNNNNNHNNNHNNNKKNVHQPTQFNEYGMIKKTSQMR